MNPIDSAWHTQGRSEFVDDIPVHAGCLYGAAYVSEVAHARILALDLEPARRAAGVVAVLAAATTSPEDARHFST